MERLVSILEEVWGSELFAALRFPFDPDQRLFVWYLVGAVAIAALVYLLQGGRRSVRACLAHLFNPRVWWHRSARLDYQILAINPLIGAGIGAASWLSTVTVAIAVSEWLGDWLGTADPSWPPWCVTVAFTVALFVADDFSRYVVHRLLHRVPALWALHKLHHSAQVLTPATVYRFHPLETALYSLRTIVTQGTVLGVFFYGFGMRLDAWDIAGANLFTFLFNLAGSNLRHSHIRLGYGRYLERLLISPAQHQLHHSNRPEHFGHNFGSFLAVWDALFGTLALSHNQRRHGYGLRPGQAEPDYANLWQAYWIPAAELVSRLGGAGRRLAAWPLTLHRSLHHPSGAGLSRGEQSLRQTTSSAGGS